jgi:hypothetical protein
MAETNVPSAPSPLAGVAHAPPVTAAGSSPTVWVDTVADLATLYGPDVEVCALRRQVDPRVAHYVDAALLSHDAERRAVATAGAARGELLDLCAHDPAARAWLDDVAELVEMYAELVGAERVGARLRVAGGPMCPRFHVDRVAVRLVCAYAGPGVEWLEGRDVDRARLGHAAGGLPDERSGLIRKGARVRRAAAFDVVLLKGEAWPGNAGRGSVHRSPAFRGRRAVLTLDALD